MIESIMALAYLSTQPYGDPSAPAAFKLVSRAFKEHQTIPLIYTCWSENLSPPLYWVNTPKNTRSLALLMFDKNAPRAQQYNWGIFNIPKSQHKLRRNANHPSLHFVKNSWGTYHYQGPCHTQGEHYYIIRLYALDIKLPPSVANSTLTFRQALRNHIIASAEIEGKSQTPLARTPAAKKLALGRFAALRSNFKLFWNTHRG